MLIMALLEREREIWNQRDRRLGELGFRWRLGGLRRCPCRDHRCFLSPFRRRLVDKLADLCSIEGSGNAAIAMKNRGLGSEGFEGDEGTEIGDVGFGVEGGEEEGGLVEPERVGVDGVAEEVGGGPRREWRL
ncbi:hypothetical protein LOK49_LG04G02078 [Camellia lanceoleosa]|uniref:Uncharacterized protein n=1 Tax=Camellia lanceoleosa TaxID=1840588 RepID=A0ACC0HZE8_9ERIC|nr:hypothetical protein LOK49_LG04G02078 [Camellia lanceoleosa]